MPLEIERRFLVAEDDEQVARRSGGFEAIEQGYVALDPAGTQVRVRRIGDACKLTVKSGSGESRFEEEIEITRESFDALWPLTEDRRLEKRRYYVENANDLCYEIDVYRGSLSGLTVVEVEFPSADESQGFRPPGWFGRELTGNDGYSNVSLAVEGLPGDHR